MTGPAAAGSLGSTPPAGQGPRVTASSAVRIVPTIREAFTRRLPGLQMGRGSGRVSHRSAHLRCAGAGQQRSKGPPVSLGLLRSVPADGAPARCRARQRGRRTPSGPPHGERTPQPTPAGTARASGVGDLGVVSLPLGAPASRGASVGPDSSGRWAPISGRSPRAVRVEWVSCYG